MLDEIEMFKPVYTEMGGEKSWAAYHEGQEVWLITNTEREAKYICDLLNKLDVICVASECTCDTE